MTRRRPEALAPQTSLQDIIRQADACRHGAQWREAQQGYARAQQLQPDDAALAHNLALCHLALGEPEAALTYARRAVELKPQQWLSALLVVKALVAQGRRQEAAPVLEALHARLPDQADVRMELARLCLHFTGDMPRLRSLVEPLLAHPPHGEDAALADAVSLLYDRDDDVSAEAASRQLVALAGRLLQSVDPATARATGRARTDGRVTGSRRLRVGLLSSQFFASPVYFFTAGALRLVATDVDLVFLHRGHKEDWATQEFKAMAREWISAQGLDAGRLADVLASSRLDALIDLGGWMDPVGLKAIGAQPVARIFKWVGGQSATTGLRGIEGYITDHHQSPPEAGALHSEPLVRFEGGYVSYLAPGYMPARRPAGSPGHDAAGRSRLGVIANPAKVSRAFLRYIASEWPRWRQERQAAGLGPLELHFIDRRYRHAPAQDRIRRLLGDVPAVFRTPHTHQDYLEEVKGLHAVLDTFPYSGGLTTTEALCLAVPVLCATDGVLFCERHTLAHALNAGLPRDAIDLQCFDGICGPAPELDLRGEMARRHASVAQQWLALLHSPRAKRVVRQRAARRNLDEGMKTAA